MRVLITGAGGNLGRAAIPILEQAGCEVRLFDSRELSSSHETVIGDVRDRGDVAEAMSGVDVVVHGAALHGIHLDGWSAQDFWSINVDGTFVVYDTARHAGVQRIVLASSMAVYGIGAGSPDRWPIITEESPLRPNDLYGLTKVIGEQTARFHADLHGMSTVALRLGMFVPETFERYGFRLLFGGVDDRDVGQAVALALEHEPQHGFAAFNIMSDNGLREDVELLAADLPAALDRRWPGTTDDVLANGAKLQDLIWGGVVYDVEAARTHLGFHPRYDFTAFLAAWRRGDRAHYPYADEPWWGANRPGA
ncbi:MAG: NAD-dependent epimerase/dehydratase family protein [Jatrophihabitantaceae bacterium]